MDIIVLDENWKIDTSGGTATLLYEKEGEVNPKTNKPSVSRDTFYYSTIKQALVGYSNRSINVCKDTGEILKKLDEIEELIKNLKI